MASTKLNRILVPTDFSETARHALRYASDIARGLGASLTMVYADPFVPPIDFSATVGGWDESSFDLLKRRAADQLQLGGETDVDPSVPFDAVVRVATPIEGILEQARDSGAGLIVMGTNGRTGLRRLGIGSVTEAIMLRSEVPVIAVPPHGATTASMQTIVCPVIYNAQCLEAVTFAAHIAPPDARFIVVRSTPADDVARAFDDFFELRAWVPQAIARRCELRMLGSEHVADQVDGLARQTHADLIVTVESGERSASDVLYGTFAARLVQHAECPVLTVNARTSLAASAIGGQR